MSPDEDPRKGNTEEVGVKLWQFHFDGKKQQNGWLKNSSDLPLDMLFQICLSFYMKPIIREFISK